MVVVVVLQQGQGAVAEKLTKLSNDSEQDKLGNPPKFFKLQAGPWGFGNCAFCLAENYVK